MPDPYTLHKLLSFFQTQHGVALLLVVTALLFNAVFLWSEFGVTTYDANDIALHLTATQQASLAIRQNVDPTDFWLTQVDLGYSLFHSYQHFPHVYLAVIDQFTSQIISLPQLFDLSIYILLVFFPLSVYTAMRRFGFEYLAAGLAAFFCSLLSTNTLMGIEYSSYIWLGYGLFTQLWGVFFFPLALAEVYRIQKGDGSWFLAVLFSAIVLLSHLIYGYILIGTALLLIFLVPNLPEIYSRFKKTVVFLVLTGIVTLYSFYSLLSDIAYVNRTVFMDTAYYTSHGAGTVLNWLVTGQLFDYGRVPVLTVFFFLSLFVVFWFRLWKDEKYRLLLVLSFFWFLAYFGPATWGNYIYTVFPFSQNILFNRFIGGFQIGAVMLTGACLPMLFDWVKQYSEKKWGSHTTKIPIIIGIVFMLVMIPVFYERIQFYDLNTQWKTDNQIAFLTKNQELSDIQKTINTLPPGRVYAGVPFDFGNDPAYKIKFTFLYTILPQLGLDTFGYQYSALGFAADTRMNFDNTRYEQYDLFNIRYVLLAKSWTPAYYYTKIKEFDDYVLYTVPTSGYFDLVDVPAVFYGPKEDVYYVGTKWMVSDLTKQKQNPILVFSTDPQNISGLPSYSFYQVYYDPPILTSLSNPQLPAGIITNESVKINVYTAKFTATRDSYLMLKTNYHPGWSVTVDGKKVKPVILEPGYIGVPVTAGTHSADFVYSPNPYRKAMFVFGILTLIVLFYNRLLIGKKV
jgi:hypothetical protein